MSLGIASPKKIFHGSHSEGWNFLDGSVANIFISGNQFWSGQKGVTMISSPPCFTSLPRTGCIMFGDGKAYLRLSYHYTFKASPPEVYMSKRSTLKYWDTLNVLMFANKSATGVPHHLNSLQ